MQAYEGYLENGQFFPIGVNTRIVGRHKVIMTLLDDAQGINNINKATENEKRKLLRALCGSIDDSSFVEPPEIPWEHYKPIEEML